MDLFKNTNENDNVVNRFERPYGNNETILITTTAPTKYSFTTTSKAKKQKIKFMLNIVLTGGTVYNKVGQYVELEDKDDFIFMVNNGFVILKYNCEDNNKGEFNFYFTSTNFNYNETYERRENMTLYMSAIIFEDSFYDSSTKPTITNTFLDYSRIAQIYADTTDLNIYPPSNALIKTKDSSIGNIYTRNPQNGFESLVDYLYNSKTNVYSKDVINWLMTVIHDKINAIDTYTTYDNLLEANSNLDVILQSQSVNVYTNGLKTLRIYMTATNDIELSHNMLMFKYISNIKHFINIVSYNAKILNQNDEFTELIPLQISVPTANGVSFSGFHYGIGSGSKIEINMIYTGD